jgi:hypothetical protein
MQDAIDLLRQAGEYQKRLFYSNFLKNNKVGEMICVNCDDSGDTYLFERWHVSGHDFVVAFCLMSEDTLLVRDTNYAYKTIASFVEEKERDNKKRFELLEKDLMEKRQMTLPELRDEIERSGKDSSFLQYVEFTREQIEDRLPPGKKTIQGDRNSCIVVLERQKEIPNDLQRPRLNEYVLGMPEEILDLMNRMEEENNDVVKGFATNFLKLPPKDLQLSTTLPFFCHTQFVKPSIYAFPERELDVERELNR